MQKFFVSNEQIKDNKIYIKGTDVNHILNVLRLDLNNEIIICNKNNGENYLCKISEKEKDIVICEVLEKLQKEESRVNITIFQGLPKFEKMELIIQKCTELGVQEITPVQMERCIVKIDEKNKSKKIERWQKISEAASKQSKRDSICKINSFCNIEDICNIVKKYDILIVPYEDEKEESFKEILKNFRQKNSDNNKINIGIVIGPEGGFCKEEIEKLKNNNAKIITLGDRILRTETVAIVMASCIMYEFGELE